MFPLKQSTAITVPFFVHDASGDAVTGLVNGGFTKRISKGSAAWGAMTVTITEMENGWYSFPLSTTHGDTLGILSITFTHASSKQVNLQFRVHARILDDLAWPTTTGRSMGVESDGHVHADLKEYLGSVPNALVSGRPDVRVGAMANLVLTAAAIAANAITDAKVASDVGIDAIKTVTDKFVFTVDNQVDANIQSINDAELVGDGNATKPWGV